MKTQSRTVVILLIALLCILYGGIVSQGKNLQVKDYTITLYSSSPNFAVLKKKIDSVNQNENYSWPLPSSVIEDSVITSISPGKISGMTMLPQVDSSLELLNQQVGSRITLETCPGGQCSTVTGTLKAVVNGNPIISDDGKLTVIRSDIQSYDLSSSELPPLYKRLKVSFAKIAPSGANFTLGYRFNGINWSPIYSLILHPHTNRLVFRGNAYIQNKTDIAYTNSRIRLVAGKPSQSTKNRLYTASFRTASAESAPTHQVFEYHLYELPQRTDIPAGKSLVREFIYASGVPYQKRYLYKPEASSKVQTFIDFTNQEKDELGLPLVSGKANLYQRNDTLTFIGSANLPSTPQGETVSLQAGAAFDITASRARLKHEEIKKDYYRDKWKIAINNRKSKLVTVKVELSQKGSWEVLRASHNYKRISASLLQFSPRIPANEEVTIVYTVDYRI